jgi:tryptophanyl-tRNA synthetase
MKKPVIFSGIQPTGNLHLGNYLGAVKNWVDLQGGGKYDCYFCIVDYHSLTGNMDPATRREQILTTAAELLALGIDPEQCTFFVQSHVPEHTELGWIFTTLTPVAELERMTQFKDKAERQTANINAGLFTYPALQAADILLYHGGLVPVGQDQVQHIELTRDIARWFNHRYGQYFPEAKPLLTAVSKIMSLLEPTKKMSKSLGADHVIELKDGPQEIERKLKRAVTATEGGGGAPGAENLLRLLKIFGESSAYETFAGAEKEGGIRYGDLKQALAKAMTGSFASFRERREKLLVNPKRIEKILEKGAKKARKVAEATMEDVRTRIGIR